MQSLLSLSRGGTTAVANATILGLSIGVDF